MSERAGRNDPCPCGSGKKYKKCCYQKDQGKGTTPALTKRAIKVIGKGASQEEKGQSKSQMFDRAVETQQRAESEAEEKAKAKAAADEKKKDDFMVPFDTVDWREEKSTAPDAWEDEEENNF